MADRILDNQTDKTPLRKHLMSMHAVEEFEPSATEASLAEFHEWDHETGEMGPPYDANDLTTYGHNSHPVGLRPTPTPSR